MSEIECDHPHGSSVPDLAPWICGRCFAKLHDRPTRYTMVPNLAVIGAQRGDVPAMRQEIVWQAAERVSADGTTLAKFLRAVARRFMRRGKMDRHDAYEMALTVTKLLEVEFGSAAECWSVEAAHDLADEEMTYWDQDGDGSNT